MTRELLAQCLFVAGACQFFILIASALVPFRLNWRSIFQSLPRLHQQMYWTYGGYVVLAIIAIALITVLNADELASGSGLARGFCGYVAAFWGIRVCLQAVFDVKEHLTTWWLRLGYHTLTVVFVSLTILYTYAALRPA